MMYAPLEAETPKKAHGGVPVNSGKFAWQSARKDYLEFSRKALAAEPIRLDSREHGTRCFLHMTFAPTSRREDWYLDRARPKVEFMPP